MKNDLEVKEFHIKSFNDEKESLLKKLDEFKNDLIDKNQ